MARSRCGAASASYCQLHARFHPGGGHCDSAMATGRVAQGLSVDGKRGFGVVFEAMAVVHRPPRPGQQMGQKHSQSLNSGAAFIDAKLDNSKKKIHHKKCDFTSRASPLAERQ